MGVGVRELDVNEGDPEVEGLAELGVVVLVARGART